MQHRYVPDLGDFSKFVVIDVLSGKGKDRTALIWYLVNPNEVGDQDNNDGKHTAYLEYDRQGIAGCSPDLYASFQAIHRTGEKNADVYARRAVLPNIDYFSELLSYAGQSLTARQQWRERWLGRALALAGESDMVVLDPDNGIMADRLSIRSQSAVKYATLDECQAFFAGGQRTLVVYQHAHRHGSAHQQATQALRRVSKYLSVKRDSVFALRFHRGTARFYLVVPAHDARQKIHARAASIIDGDWGKRGHFSLID